MQLGADHSSKNQSRKRALPRNLWAVSLTSFLTDISSEMVINLLPLFLANVLGVRTGVIGLIEGVAESTASLLKLFSGWISDRLQQRKWLAVAGYGISAAVKPLYLLATSWLVVAGVRWGDRVGKGIRTAPRDALIADSVTSGRRGLAFGFHRAADTAGAVVGLLAGAGLVWLLQQNSLDLNQNTFQIIVLVSLVPAFLAVLILALGARDVRINALASPRRSTLRDLGKPFLIFLMIVAVFDLGNSSDAFLVLLAQERGLSVSGILIMLVVFNLVYALISTPAGWISDRLGRLKVIIAGWLLYGLIYLGFGLARSGTQILVLYAFYGVYYGLTYGTAKALVTDLVPAAQRGTAFGTYNAVLGILDLPASLVAGILWQGVGAWSGFGPSAPFFWGAGLAVTAAVLLILWGGKYQQGAEVLSS